MSAQQTASTTEPAGPDSGRPGATIALFGLTPGVGASVLAANLAIALRQTSGAPVILFEAHYDLGNQASLLGLTPQRHLGHALDGSVAPALLRHESGIDVLLRSPFGLVPTRPQMHALLAQARATAAYTVVDSMFRYDDGFRGLLEEADRILLVTTPELAVLHRADRALRLITSWGLLDRLGVAVNRWESESAVAPAQLHALFGDRIIGRLPSAGPLVVESINTSQPFVMTATDHPLSRAVLALADHLRDQLKRGAATAGARVSATAALSGLLQPVAAPDRGG